LPVTIVAWWPGLWLAGRSVARICVTGDAGSIRAAVAGGIISLRDDGLVRYRSETRPGRVPGIGRVPRRSRGLLAAARPGLAGLAVAMTSVLAIAMAV